MNSLKPAECLVVGTNFDTCDLRGSPKVWFRERLFELLVSLRGIKGIHIKIESPLRGDYELMEIVRHHGFKIFADLKLYGTSSTLEEDGVRLRYWRPEVLTVSSTVGVKGMKALKAELPDTRVIAVTTLTTFNEVECNEYYRRSILNNTIDLSLNASRAKLDGIVCAPNLVKLIRKYSDLGKLSIFTPNIRTDWYKVQNDDQNQEGTMTPREALEAGSDYLIVGRPITLAKNPYDAVMRIIEEIAVTKGFWVTGIR